MNAPTTIEELTQGIQLTALVKRTLHEIGPATTSAISDHLGLHKDDRDSVSKAIYALRKNNEVTRCPGDERPANWQVNTKKNKQTLTSDHQPASVKNAAKPPPKTNAATTKPAKAPAGKPTPAATKAATKPQANVTDIHQPSTSKPTNPDQRTASTILTDIKQRLDQLDHLMATPPQHISDREEKTRLLEILAGQMNDDIGAKLLEISRDLLTADGRIPPLYTNTTDTAA